MKKYILGLILLFAMTTAFAQPGKKTASSQKAPSQAEMDKMMEEAMKGMSPQEKAEMKKMMGGVMENMATKPGPVATAFTDNKKLVPAKDLNRIKSIPAKAFTDADVIANSTLLYNKLMAKITPAQKAIVNKVLAVAKNGPALTSASITCLMQGHDLAAMALAMKAVQADAKNVNYQNNLAAILSQSGYPEKAVPYLQKLAKQTPNNSTVLHNLGYAWLSLGEVDTASRYFARAAARNPNNPETKLCQGVIAELKGDPKKAADNYVESFEESPNPFAESMAKNVNAENRLEKIDFDKLKKRIVIHEYFKRNWIKVPVMSDNVSGYESDMRIKNGYAKMFEDLKNKIELMTEASNAEVQALADKGESEFVATMANEMMRGVNMMSMPAVYVNKIMQIYVSKWMEKYVKEHQALMDEIRIKKEKMTKAGKEDKCPDFDKKNNDFLKYANPRIRDFHTQKIEEFRVWLNAICTWSWYIVGNPKNVVMTQCISWTGAFVSFLESAVNEQYSYAKTCVQQNGDGLENVSSPNIPNFSCPAVVSMPVGLDELRISAQSVNFDDNSWSIAQAAGTMPHNLTIGVGVGRDHIAEPGKFGAPYSKTANGSFATMGMDESEDDLTPLSKIPLDDLALLDPNLLDVSKKSKLKSVNDMLRARLAKKLLSDMLSVKCPGELPKKNTRKPKLYDDAEKIHQDPLILGLGELEIYDEETKAWVNAKGEYRFESGLIVSMGELELLDAEIKTSKEIKAEKISKDGFKVGLGELELWDEGTQAWVNAKGEHRFKSGLIVSMGELVLEDVNTNGPQPTITNGLEMVTTMQDFIKGLFQ